MYEHLHIVHACVTNMHGTCMLYDTWFKQMHTFLSSYQCDASEATWKLIKVVLEENGVEPPPRIMFLGGGCSLATEPLAALAGHFYNVTQVSLIF